MNRNNILQHISSVPLFSGFSSAQRERLAKIALVRSYAGGQAVFSEGERAGGLYIVLEGRVKIYKLSPEGKEQILHLAGPGETVGEGALFSGTAFPAYAEAFEASRLLFVGRESLIGLIGDDPSFAMAMLGVLSMRLRRFVRVIEGLSLREAPGRLASYLLFLEAQQPDRDMVALDMSKGNLASFLGTTPETLSRIIARMEEAALIKGHGARIKIENRKGLEALAEGERKLP